MSTPVHPGWAEELLRRMGPTCDGCSKTLEQVFPGTPPEVLQYDNALHVRFDGGYGEFIDNIEVALGGSPDRYLAIICHECAHDLCERVPWIKALLQPERSHTHKEVQA